MPDVVSNGLTIHYDEFGDRRDPTVLLVMGLGTQMIAWRSELCATLAARGLHVVRFDNRDIGLSTKIHGAPIPSIPQTLILRSLGLARPAYTLADMARDAVGLLDALGVEKAHLAGVSMGGMIAQQLAIDHPRRALSLTSIMSSTGERHLPPPAPSARTVFMRPVPRTREEAIANVVWLYRTIGSPSFFDAGKVAERAGESYDRSSYRVGTARQVDAILCSPPRTQGLRSLRIPATVVHGALDPLVLADHGRATARAIPGAELRIIEDLAHDLPDEHWDTLRSAIERSIERAV
jgi:pimeloyl-ACP methyl ester carboxylesterase